MALSARQKAVRRKARSRRDSHSTSRERNTANGRFMAGPKGGHPIRYRGVAYGDIGQMREQDAEALHQRIGWPLKALCVGSTTLEYSSAQQVVHIQGTDEPGTLINHQ